MQNNYPAFIAGFFVDKIALGSLFLYNRWLICHGCVLLETEEYPWGGVV